MTLHYVFTVFYRVKSACLGLSCWLFRELPRDVSFPDVAELRYPNLTIIHFNQPFILQPLKLWAKKGFRQFPELLLELLLINWQPQVKPTHHFPHHIRSSGFCKLINWQSSSVNSRHVLVYVLNVRVRKALEIPHEAASSSGKLP